MKRVILGTAGHIDHGKTELIRALTGIDTDRLKEEKERGISIELGFAYLDLGDDIRMGIIDVPGHERFVRQMVAGSGGIDLAALVVALDEGVMPQTEEHLDILGILGIPLGVVVLTKLDLVDDELALLAEEDAKEAVKGTFLEAAPMIRVSSRTGEGLDRLRSVLTELSLQVRERPAYGMMRLPVDRVFTLKGHGTVVTGTLISGTLSVGDDVIVRPGDVRSSVRSVQSHNRQEERALPGERVAVNLRGVEQSQLSRGTVLTHPDQFYPSYIVDVKLNTLPRSPTPLKNRQKVRLHHYTTEVEARVILADREILEPGQECMAQLRAAAPIVPAAGDRFVIRALSPSITIGGGVVLNPRGIKLKARMLKVFTQLDQEDHEGIVLALIRSSGLAGCTRTELLALSSLTSKQLDRILESLRNSRTVVRHDPTEDRYVHGDFVNVLTKRIVNRLTSFHAEHPLREGMPKQELRSTVPGGDKLFKKMMELLTSTGEIIDRGDTVTSASHRVQLKEEERGLQDQLLKLIVSGGNSPPTLKEIQTQTGGETKQIRNLLDILEKEKKVVRVKEDLYFSEGFIRSTKKRLVEFIKLQGSITPSQFHEVTGSSRKYNIPLLEYFDRERFTLRVGDQRVLRGSGNSSDGGSVA
jgi:selenocysteine-specific elongation factor